MKCKVFVIAAFVFVASAPVCIPVRAQKITSVEIDSYFGMKGMDRIRQYFLAEQKAITNAENRESP
jgi:hypothetical protein